MRFWSLNGLTHYGRARELQISLLELRASGQVADTVLFLEHPPVLTRGRGLQFTGVSRERHMPVPVGIPPEIAFYESERGGDLTYHGPGQLVIYPIVRLDGEGFAPFHDVGGYLRRMEQIVIDELASRGVGACSKKDAAGVWVGDRKVASLGIAVKKWVSFHGLALNVVNDLAPFGFFSPCGYPSEVMTRLQDLLPTDDWSQWRSDLEQALAHRMALSPAPMERLSIDEACLRCEAQKRK